MKQGIRELIPVLNKVIPLMILLFACVSFLKDILLNFENISNIFIKFFWKQLEYFLL